MSMQNIRCVLIIVVVNTILQIPFFAHADFSDANSAYKHTAIYKFTSLLIYLPKTGRSPMVVK